MAKQEPPHNVPARFLQEVVAYRSMGAEALIMGCGFGRVTGNGIDIERRISGDYSGNLVLAGVGWLRDDPTGKVYPLAPGSFFQRLPGREHTVHLEPGTDYAECWVHLCRPLFDVLAALGALSIQPVVWDAGIDLALISAWNDEVTSLRNSHERDLPKHVSLLVGLAAGAVARRTASPNAEDPYARLIDDACQMLIEDHGDRRPLAALASRYHLSYERFRKVFRERTGLSPAAYRIRRRIDRAREWLLADRERPIKAIAEALGYGNPFIFSAQFKQLVGVSPGAFRRGH